MPVNKHKLFGELFLSTMAQILYLQKNLKLKKNFGR